MANCDAYWHTKEQAGLQTHSVPVAFLFTSTWYPKLFPPPSFFFPYNTSILTTESIGSLGALLDHLPPCHFLPLSLFLSLDHATTHLPPHTPSLVLMTFKFLGLYSFSYLQQIFLNQSWSIPIFISRNQMQNQLLGLDTYFPVEILKWLIELLYIYHEMLDIQMV